MRQRWRDYESRKNGGHGETNPLSKLLTFVALCCTVAFCLNMHLLRQYQVNVSGEYYSAVRPVLFVILSTNNKYFAEWVM